MNFSQLQSSYRAAADQSGLLGTLFWWDLGANRVTYPALVQSAKAFSLDEEFLPAAVKPASAFRRAWRALSRRADSDLLLRQIAETPEQIVVAVVRERADVTNLDLRYEVVARVSYSKLHQVVTILERTPLTEEIQQLFEHFSAITTEDVRAMVIGFVRKSGLSIRHAGGVYFIPPALTPTLDALSAVLKATGKNTVWTIPVANLGDAGATLAQLAKDTLDAEVAAVEAELAGFDARDIEVRSSTLERRLVRFDELRARASLMASALSFRADSLLEKLTDLELGVRRKLTGDTNTLPAVLDDADEPGDADADFHNAPGPAEELRTSPFDAEAGF